MKVKRFWRDVMGVAREQVVMLPPRFAAPPPLSLHRTAVGTSPLVQPKGPARMVATGLLSPALGAWPSSRHLRAFVLVSPAVMKCARRYGGRRKAAGGDRIWRCKPPNPTAMSWGLGAAVAEVDRGRVCTSSLRTPPPSPFFKVSYKTATRGSGVGGSNCAWERLWRHVGWSAWGRGAGDSLRGQVASAAPYPSPTVRWQRGSWCLWC
jgi:hypothetical protein